MPTAPSVFWVFIAGMATVITQCIGHILGAVFVYLAESAASNLLHGTTLLLIYSLGVGTPMLTIAYSGKRISSRINWFVKRSHFFKKLYGLVLILVVLMMLFEIDKYLKKILLPYLSVYI